jgi:outer membrane lipoprotein SlyB
MGRTLSPLALIAALAFIPAPANAAGCFKGAVVGGVAGHYAHHHAILGAIAGCAVGHHMAAKQEREKMEREKAQQGQVRGSQGNY